MVRHQAPFIVFIVLIAAVVLLQPGAHAAGKPLVVIISASAPVKDISLGLLRRAFLGEVAEYVSGKRLLPINHPPGTPSRGEFDQAVLGLKPAEMGRFWIDRRIRDQPPPPRAAPNAELVVRLVMSLPGAISYAPPELVNDKVRVLTIDGKAPGQPGYPLAQ